MTEETKTQAAPAQPIEQRAEIPELSQALERIASLEERVQDLQYQIAIMQGGVNGAPH